VTWKNVGSDAVPDGTHPKDGKDPCECEMARSQASPGRLASSHFAPAAIHGCTPRPFPAAPKEKGCPSASGSVQSPAPTDPVWLGCDDLKRLTVRAGTLVPEYWGSSIPPGLGTSVQPSRCSSTFSQEGYWLAAGTSCCSFIRRQREARAAVMPAQRVREQEHVSRVCNDSSAADTLDGAAPRMGWWPGTHAELCQRTCPFNCTGRGGGTIIGALGALG
jgi:hypothetical protein